MEAPRGVLTLLVVGWLVLLVASPAPAQTGPGTAVPTQAEPRSQDERVGPGERPSGETEIPLLTLPLRDAPEGAEQLSVVLGRVDITGITAYAAGAFQEFYRDLLGKKVTLATLFEVAAAIEARYRRDGYVLSRVVVPPQTIREGVFRIRVIEGFISEVVSRGDVGDVKTLIDRHLARITVERPVRIATLERYLLLINDLPGITALGVLRPGRAGPGSAQLVVSLARKRYDVTIAGDNRGSRFIGPSAASITVGSNAATVRGERIEATAFSTTQFTEQQFYSISVRSRLGSDGLVARASFSASPAQPGFTLKALDIETFAHRTKVSLEFPIIRSRRLNILVSGGLDRSYTELESASQGLSASDRLTVAWGRLGFDFRDSLAGFSTLDLGLRQGLHALGASPNDDPTPSRIEGRSDFTLFQVGVSRLQRVYPGFSIQLNGNLQWAQTPLLADEEFAIGGSEFGRAFDPAEFSGDDGIGGSLELQIEPDPLFGISTGPLSFLQLYGFVDYGRIKNLAATVNQREEVVSAGGGIRLNVSDWLSAGFEVARPINRPLAVDGDRKQHNRYLFNIGVRF